MWWRTSNLQTTTHLSTREDERLSWPGWLTYSGRLTHISGHTSATGRAQDGERTLARDRRSTAEPRGYHDCNEWYGKTGLQTDANTHTCTETLLLSAEYFMLSSYHQHRKKQDCLVLSCPCRRCEQNWQQVGFTYQ